MGGKLRRIELTGESAPHAASVPGSSSATLSGYRSRNLKYDLLYERSGYWTRVDFTDSTVAFLLGRNHYAGAIFGAVMFAAVFAGILMVPAGNRIWFVPIFFALLPFTLHSGFKKIRQRYSHLPIVLSDQPTGGEGENKIPFSHIKRLLVRENTGRQSDDTALAQLYAVLNNTDSHLLLHQHYLARKKMVLEMGAKVSSKLNVPLDDEL